MLGGISWSHYRTVSLPDGFSHYQMGSGPDLELSTRLPVAVISSM